MKLLRLKKKMLAVMLFTYTGVLAMGIAYAALSGMVDFSGTAALEADLDVSIVILDSDLGPCVPTKYGSKITGALSSDRKSLEFTVTLNAPEDYVYYTFRLKNDGVLPVEFGTPVINVTGPKYTNPETLQEITPLLIEGYANPDTETLDFDDVDGLTLYAKNEESPKYGIAFHWDENAQIETTDITFTVDFPYFIGDPEPPAPATGP